jgi:hypothetical protein
MECPDTLPARTAEQSTAQALLMGWQAYGTDRRGETNWRIHLHEPRLKKLICFSVRQIALKLVLNNAMCFLLSGSMGFVQRRTGFNKLKVNLRHRERSDIRLRVKVKDIQVLGSMSNYLFLE